MGHRIFFFRPVTEGDRKRGGGGGGDSLGGRNWKKLIIKRFQLYIVCYFALEMNKEPRWELLWKGGAN